MGPVRSENEKINTFTYAILDIKDVALLKTIFYFYKVLTHCQSTFDI